ncbi:MAG: hypothetical protein ACK5C5_00885 [Bacteroidota bacterium]
MKKVFLALFVFSLVLSAQGQITINSASIPVAGDTFRYSNAQITSAIDPIPTGANYTWDFSFLQPISQDIDTFRTVASTGTTYAFYFADLSFNANRSNQAKKGNLGLPNVPIGGGVTVSDVVAFYYKSNTLYQQTGYGATINSIGVPVGFNNKDVIYRFPMNFGDVDTSASDFNISIPNLGYYGHDQVRVTEVDGWGTLITPFGSFNTLRLKSSITGNDTLFLDTLGFGFQFPSPPTTEYKWLGTTKSIPLLQITTTGGQFGGGTQNVTSVVFRDSLRSFTSLDENLTTIGSLTLMPNPVQSWVSIKLNSQVQGTGSIRMISIDGKFSKEIWNGDLYHGGNIINCDIARFNPAPGVYVLEVSSAGRLARTRMIVVR